MANKRHTKYIETAEFPGNTHLEITVYYDLGGMNGFNGSMQPRGFYLSVTPVRKENFMVCMALFSGLKRFILPANRFSEKQLNLAVEKSKEYEQELIEAVKVKNQKAA